VIPPEIVYRDLNFGDITLRLLDGGGPATLSMPPLDVVYHFVDTALFLADLLADLADAGLVRRTIHQLQAARLAGAVLLVTLLAEVPPFPVPASPPCLLKVAHGWRTRRGGAAVWRAGTSMLDSVESSVGLAGATEGNGVAWASLSAVVFCAGFPRLR
jgi:hypothetical protein